MVVVLVYPLYIQQFWCLRNDAILLPDRTLLRLGEVK